MSLNNSRKKEHVLLYKVLYSAIIVAIYIIGINIPLYGVDTQANKDLHIDAQQILKQTLNGDIRNSSIFSLGLWSYMMASMFVMLMVSIISIDKTHKVFPKKISRATIILTVIFASVQAYTNIQNFTYTSSKYLILTKAIDFLEMITGMLLVVFLCERMGKYGIGGRTTVFVINVFDGLLTMLDGMSMEKIFLPAAIAVAEIAIMLFMETREKRIPVQRVSIHNIYADKNYIAYKFNPVGVMPIMFASVAFILPQFISSFLAEILPNNPAVSYVAENMVLTKPLGIWVYMAVIVILNVSFSFIMLSPGVTADNLLKAGDSILDIYAGRQTKHYLIRTILMLSLISSVVMALCQGVPLFLQFDGLVDEKLAMLPSSAMMLTGMWISIHREAKVYRNIDKYELLV